MLRKMLVVLCVCALSAGVISCQKLGRQEAGLLPVETIEFKDAIPLDYGELVAVIPRPEAQGEFSLWFEKPDKTIAVVWVNLVSGTIGPEVATIPRR